LRARAVTVQDGKVRAFCSADCKARAKLGVDAAPSVEDALRAIEPVSPWRRPSVRAALGGIVLLGAIGAMVARSHHGVPAPIASAQAAKVPQSAPTADEAMALLAKSAPGPDAEADVWIHPLAGPQRHLPERDTRRFGAAREGLRPEECEGGHCGVDIGTVKGDVVMAIHDGVVERVERDPEVGGRRGNEGRFIRVVHKGGTIVSSYIHLDGVREDLRPGVPVKVGEAIGTVGDTGVKESGPHLHFAISVRKDADSAELFINPEPMLHLWPVKARAIASLHRMEPAPRPHPKTARAETSPPEDL
jgi:murein DD-endopeptidase MepM/ murein hydrolase activator NlpD